MMTHARSLLALLALASLLFGCHPGPKPPATPIEEKCALIVTDDDIPSGSATAGALYIGTDELGQRLLTSDVLAVAEGFQQAGYRCVVVADSHDGAIDRKRVTERGLLLLTPSDKQRWELPFIGDFGPRYRISALVGYHSRAGRKDGFRPHTVNDFVRDARLNGQPIGEVTMEMMVLAGLGMPTVLVTGDHLAAEEATAAAPGIEAVRVRWRDASGKVGFLSEQEAPAVLREAARRAASRPTPQMMVRFPVELSIEAFSPKRAEVALRQVLAEQAELDELLSKVGHGPLKLAPTRHGAELRWSAADPIAAAFSAELVASDCMLPGTRRAWNWLDKGFAAREAKRYDEAAAAFRKAIEADPEDPAHHCRLGGVHLAQGQLKLARAELRQGVDRLADIIGSPMKVVCLSQLAATLERSSETQDLAKAAELYRRVLALPDHLGSQERARTALQKLEHTPE